ncbi:amidase [Gluconacetobacter sacchari]|uniref:amidase n=1 Tax=Gluconacetobacter sacchari TaxID=92759 RepID=UPI0039B5FFBD
MTGQTIDPTARIAHIARFEPGIQAFAAHDPDRLEQDLATAPPGPLNGRLVGVKDIVDTQHYPTGYGSEIYAGHRATGDAACVALLRAAGASMAGKTVTTEFAFFRPGPTTNPFDPARTPGGSSSGSAAAVAMGMVDIGIASQTAASLTRPASYCGVVGFKPTYGRYALSGVKALGPSFDALGTITPDVATAIAADAVLAAPVPATLPVSPRAPARIGICRTPWWNEAEEGTRMAMEEAERLFGAHTAVETVQMDDFAAAADLHVTIMSFEAAQALAWEYQARRDMCSPQIVGLIEAGRKITRAAYEQAQTQAADLRRRAAALFAQYDMLVAPAAPGEAPLRSQGTGSPIFSRLWTLLYLPTVTLPGLLGPSGLPVGIQCLAPHGTDHALLGHALWAEALLPARPMPPALKS